MYNTINKEISQRTIRSPPIDVRYDRLNSKTKYNVKCYNNWHNCTNTLFS